MNNLKKIFAEILTIGLLIYSMSCLTVSAYAPSGMKDNGQGGIYIDINAEPYTTFAGYSYGQYAYTTEGCAWYASARVNQLTGKGNTIWSGKSWYNSGYANLGFSRGSTPQSGSLICWSNHVAVLERIDGDTAYISEGGVKSIGSEYGYCKLSTTSVSQISSRNSGFLGYVYFGSGTPPTASSVSVTTTNAQNVSETNATVYGTVSYSGSKPSEVGIYFGTSPDSMNKAARDSISHNKNPFDMWYDLNSEAGQYLSPGTTYYWQCYAIVDGGETRGEVKSFVTNGSSASNSVSVTTTNAQNVSETNATVYGAVSYSGSKPSEVGIYFGTSPDSMNKAARDSINHNKNPFDMWYDLNSEAGQYLSPGTTYYWQCYAIVDGGETKGEIKSFTTGGARPTEPPAPVPVPAPTVQPTPIPTPIPTKVPEADPIQNTVPDIPQKTLTVSNSGILVIAINNKTVNFPDAGPFIDENDRTQVPVRAISEMLNCNVDWIPESRTVFITKDNGEVVIITVNSNVMVNNGNKVQMDTSAMIINERTYIPLRFVAEALGLKVEWK